jgi:hypothetical protein
VGSGILSSGAGSVLSALASWVVSGASWLLGQIGGVLSSSTSVDLGAGWFEAHYQVMAGLAGVVVLPLLLMSAVQAVYHQTPGPLVHSVMVQLPLAALLTAAAVQLVQMSLAATDALSAAVAGGSGGAIQNVLTGLANLIVSEIGAGPQSPPTFVLLLGGLLVAMGAFALWVELLVRAAAVYVAVLFLPLALASLVWPAISHWCRRLADTLVALILAKFVIVAVLSLAAAAVASGTGAGFASVLGGGALLLLAAFTPFTLLRLVPAVEAGAVHQLEGMRHRARQALGSAPRTAAAFALQAARASSFETGSPGTGLHTAISTPGSGGGSTGGSTGGSSDAGHRAGGEGRAPGTGGRSGGRAGPGRRQGGGFGGRSHAAPGSSRTDGARGTDGGSATSAGTIGVEVWRGRPMPEWDSASLTRGQVDPAFVPWSEGGDPSGRGPLPLWGSPDGLPPGESGLAGAAPSPVGTSTGGSIAGGSGGGLAGGSGGGPAMGGRSSARALPPARFRVEDDRIGPRMQWELPSGERGGSGNG